MLRRFREPVNSLTHLIAAAVAFAGTIVLAFLARNDAVKLASLILYGLTLVLMFSSSGLYHLAQAGPKITLFLRKLDHSAIYLLIAGTYTPICLHYFTGFWRGGFLAIVWALGLIGITVKLFVINAPRWVTAGIYLLMGWLAIAGVGEILAQMPAGAILWLLAGGLFFTGGAFVYMLKKPDPFPDVFGFHEIWHIFVILGAYSHFALMLIYVAPGGAA
ncbi:MAG: hemolysin III family protein [Anaerolineales bacterium]|nr:hemolysin III family protein [Anaerolineales bacterium]